MSSSATDAVVFVTMPQMGVSVAEGTVIEWRKQVGDWVEADETICEISSDKIDAEVPAPASGTVAEIMVEVGATVPVGAELARLETGAQRGGGDSNGSPDRSRFHSPVVQRMAAEHGIDLATVKGTGVGGRITKKDLAAYVERAPEPPLHSDSPYLAHTERQARPAGKRQPMSPMRKQIAEHMLRSRRTAAHCTTVVEVDMSRVAERRAALSEALAGRGVALTHLAFVARATVAALQAHPALNASVDGEDIVQHADVNLGIAVALEPEGLIVPVIRQAQRLSLEGIAAAIAETAARAREGGLSHADVEDGTFTITNPGAFGAILATPIINQPQVAILDLEAIVKRPVAVEGPDGDAIAVRPMANLCMSWDHRALDGVEAARFLGEVKRRLEDWAE